MKTLLLVAFCGLTLLSVCPASAQVYITSVGESSEHQALGSQPQAQPQLINMNGTAEIRVVPDLIDLHFEVLVRNRDFEAARKDHEDRAAKVLTALRAAGIKEADLQASQTKISSKYKDRNNEDTTAVEYFQVSQDFGCTLHDPARVSEVTGMVVAAGVTGVDEAQLRTSELRKYRDEARHKASVAAREKAEALAAEIGMKIGKATFIREDSSSRFYPQNNRSQNAFNISQNTSTASGGGAPEDGGSNFAPGLISVSAGVDVTFVLKE